VHFLVVIFSAAVVAWSSTSSVIRSVSSLTHVVDTQLLVDFVPEALCNLLANSPWQQIADKVSAFQNCQGRPRAPRRRKMRVGNPQGDKI